MVDTDDTRRTTDGGQHHGYGISSPQVSIKLGALPKFGKSGMTTSTSRKIKEAMMQDEQMQCLIKTVQNGWPDYKIRSTRLYKELNQFQRRTYHTRWFTV